MVREWTGQTLQLEFCDFYAIFILHLSRTRIQFQENEWSGFEVLRSFPVNMAKRIYEERRRIYQSFYFVAIKPATFGTVSVPRYNHRNQFVKKKKKSKH